MEERVTSRCGGYKVAKDGGVDNLLFGDSIKRFMPELPDTERALILTRFYLHKNNTEMKHLFPGVPVGKVMDRLTEATSHLGQIIVRKNVL